MSEPPVKKARKEKKDKADKSEKAAEAPEISYDERLKAVGPISTPMASEKLTKKLHKLVRKASAAKGIRRGVKEVIKALRKNESGICVIAGDISPIDVISHVSIFCEEKSVPYIYVPSKQDLGAAACTKRPTSVILIQSKKDFGEKELFDKTLSEVEKAAVSFK